MAKKRILSLLLATTLAVSMAACGGKTEEKNDTAAVTTAETTAETQGTTESGEKHLNAALFWFGGSLDPHKDWDGWTTCRAGMTETLVTVDENYEIQPLLAESWEQYDDCTWIMHIREGVTFQDGTPVDGAAVEASFKRAMETQERAVTAAKIADVTSVDMDVTITTSEPFGAFLANISEPMYSVIKVGDDQDYENKPIATGPFMAVDFAVNDYIELAKYDGYWNGASDVDTVTVKLIEDDSTRGYAVQSGEMDVVQRIANTDLAMYQSDDAYTVYDTTGARERVLVFNHDNPVIQDANVRKALACAIDYETLTKVMGGSVNVAGAPYPASAPYGYDELDKQHYDKDAAVAALEAAGYADSDGDGIVDKDGEALSLTITYSDANYTSMLEAVQSMAKESGIDLALNLSDDLSSVEADGNFDIIGTNWQVLSTGDPQWFLDSLYKTGSASNYSKYSSADLDAVIEKLAGTFDVAERTALTVEAEKLLLEDNASIWLVGENNFVLANANVTNVTPYPIDYYFLDNKISIEK